MTVIHRIIAFLTRQHAGVVQVTAVISKTKQQIAAIEAGAEHIYQTIRDKTEEVAALNTEIDALHTVKAEALAFSSKLKSLLS